MSKKTCPIRDGGVPARRSSRGLARPARACVRIAVCFSVALWVLGATVGPAQSDESHRSAEACVTDGRPLRFGFFTDFPPVSFSESPDPGSPAFDAHRGYEADLLTALEHMAGANLAFDRKGIGTWPEIWLRPVGLEYDFVGGGITILDSRTRDADGMEQVAFTSGHISFRQSLLVRAEDAERYGSYAALADARVAALAGTTGEHRLLALTGVANAGGSLAAGTAIHLADGTVLTADGSADYRITAAGASRKLAQRVRIEGPPGTVKALLLLATDREQLQASRTRASGRGRPRGGWQPGGVPRLRLPLRCGGA